MNLDEFIEQVCQRPLPQNSMARIRTLAKELAEGAIGEVWPNIIFAPWFRDYENDRIGGNHFPDNDAITEYLKRRWKNDYPNLRTVEINGYLDERKKDNFYLSNEAFDLLEDAEPSTIFISCRRRESSAFALLVLVRLKQEGLEPFLDMALEPGEDWQAGLKEYIQSRDFFILLLGNTTLESPYVSNEIEWALEKDLAIIPIWQPDFEFSADEWPDLPDAIKYKISNTHSIKVQDENPLEYDKALTELLNRFGITP